MKLAPAVPTMLLLLLSSWQLSPIAATKMTRGATAAGDDTMLGGNQQGLRGQRRGLGMMGMGKGMMMMKMMMGGAEESGEVSCETCSSGSYFDGCNECTCDDRGSPFCTYRFCEEKELEEPVCHPPGEDVSCETCSSGSYFDGCNECTCDARGSAICTFRFCEEKELEEPVCHPEEPPGEDVSCETCDSGYFDGCNNCACDDQGRAACTRKFCRDFDLEEPFCFKDDPSEPSCETCPSGYFTYDGCNACKCTAEGVPHCTKKACFPGLEASCLGPPMDCRLVRCAAPPPCEEMGMVEIIPPNGCCPICVKVDEDHDDDEPDCSAVTCFRPDCKDGQELIVPDGECCPKCSCEACENGMFNDGCNDCICKEDGSVECTDWRCIWDGPATCIDEDGPDCSAVSCLIPECKEGQKLIVPEGECCPECTCEACDSGLFNDGCNDCICLDDGSVECTERYCFWEGTPKCIEEDDHDDDHDECPDVCPMMKCVPGQVPIQVEGECCPKCACAACSSGAFNDGCNDCECLDDGFSVECTEKGCYAPVEPYCLKAEEPPYHGKASCETCPSGRYYDGCNSCDCSSGEEVCDDRYCKKYGEAFCEEPEDCSLILCPPAPNCEKAGKIPVVPPGECCPICSDDCTLVDCFPVDCAADGKVEYIPIGECCPVCVEPTDGGTGGGDPVKPDCSAVSCLVPECKEEGVDPWVPPGTCCPVCPLTCNACPNGYNDGCNNCYCDENGNAGCTEMACSIYGPPSCMGPPPPRSEETGTNSNENWVGCTLDAKECDDGSFVGRDPENDCEFKPCPEKP